MTGKGERIVLIKRKRLDHTLIHEYKHLQRVVEEYTACFNQERLHQAIGQRIPDQYALSKSKPMDGRIILKSILGGLHHSYSRSTHLN
jgi:hypothetical protein